MYTWACGPVHFSSNACCDGDALITVVIAEHWYSIETLHSSQFLCQRFLVSVWEKLGFHPISFAHTVGQSFKLYYFAMRDFYNALMFVWVL